MKYRVLICFISSCKENSSLMLIDSFWNLKHTHTHMFVYNNKHNKRYSLGFLGWFLCFLSGGETTVLRFWINVISISFWLKLFAPVAKRGKDWEYDEDIFSGSALLIRNKHYQNKYQSKGIEMMMMMKKCAICKNIP